MQKEDDVRSYSDVQLHAHEGCERTQIRKRKLKKKSIAGYNVLEMRSTRKIDEACVSSTDESSSWDQIRAILASYLAMPSRAITPSCLWYQETCRYNRYTISQITVQFRMASKRELHLIIWFYSIPKIVLTAFFKNGLSLRNSISLPYITVWLFVGQRYIFMSSWVVDIIIDLIKRPESRRRAFRSWRESLQTRSLPEALDLSDKTLQSISPLLASRASAIYVRSCRHYVIGYDQRRSAGSQFYPKPFNLCHSQKGIVF